MDLPKIETSARLNMFTATTVGPCGGSLVRESKLLRQRTGKSENNHGLRFRTAIQPPDSRIEERGHSHFTAHHQTDKSDADHIDKVHHS
jgi:hypothetical protein